MSFTSTASPNFSELCSNQRRLGYKKYQDRNQHEIFHKRESSSNTYGRKTLPQLSCENKYIISVENENDDYCKIEETDRRKKVELELEVTSCGDNHDGMDEFCDDQPFSYQDLPSPPAAGSEMDESDVHTDSDKETSLCLVQDESICLLSGDKKVFDKVQFL